MNTKLAERIIRDFGVETLLKVHEAKVAMSCTKVKLKNICMDDPKHVPFRSRVAKKHNIDERYIAIYVELSLQDSLDSMKGMGGCKGADFTEAYKLINEL